MAQHGPKLKLSPMILPEETKLLEYHQPVQLLDFLVVSEDGDQHDKSFDRKLFSPISRHDHDTTIQKGEVAAVGFQWKLQVVYLQLKVQRLPRF